MNTTTEFGYFTETDGLFLRYTSARCLIVRRNEGVDCVLEEVSNPPAKNNQAAIAKRLAGWANTFFWLEQIQKRRKEKR